MDFFDNAIDKAKEAIDIVSKKTNEVVNVGKQKFDIASLESKRSKDFEVLGEIYYNLIKDTEIEDVDTKNLVDAITDKNLKIAKAKQDINNTKNKRVCPECSAIIDDTAVYCPVCGVKLDVE